VTKAVRNEAVEIAFDERESQALGMLARGMTCADVASELRMHSSSFACLRSALRDKLDAVQPVDLRRVTLQCLLAER
jgi:DNA-binding CsgD family transcriptional regulator